MTNMPDFNTRQLISSKHLLSHACKACMEYLEVVRRILWDEVTGGRVMRELVSVSHCNHLLKASIN